MKRCKLFGDQCFKRNMTFTIAWLVVDDFFSPGTDCYWFPMHEKIAQLTDLVPLAARIQNRDIDIYYRRAAQYHTRPSELHLCLTAFEDDQ